MKETIPSPPLAALLDALGTRSYLDMAEVRIGVTPSGYELRHVADAPAPAAQLRPIQLEELANLAQSTATGAFRPIKTAPNLQRGWICEVIGAARLALALDALYPGALTDWWAAAQAEPPVQHYREFVGRQTGMYRIAQQLTDDEAAAVIRAGCEATFCLRRRLWTVEGLPVDPPASGKSVIPCLEPCPLMLEFARRGRRLVQSDPVELRLVADEVGTLVAALDTALAHPRERAREGDLADPANPRRIRLLRDRLQGLFPTRPTEGTQPL